MYLIDWGLDLTHGTCHGIDRALGHGITWCYIFRSRLERWYCSDSVARVVILTLQIVVFWGLTHLAQILVEILWK